MKKPSTPEDAAENEQPDRWLSGRASQTAMTAHQDSSRGNRAGLNLKGTGLVATAQVPSCWGHSTTQAAPQL